MPGFNSTQCTSVPTGIFRSGSEFPGLIGASRHPETSRILAGFTIFALILSALYRMLVWLMGDHYVWLGDLPRAEAAVFLLIALGLLWWMPRRTASQGGS